MGNFNNKKYFGEKPLEGPTKLSSLYKDRSYHDKFSNDRSARPQGNHNNDRHHERLNRFLRSYLSANQLAEYGDLSKETGEKLLIILDKEQAHRHQKEISLTKSYATTDRVRLLCSLLFGLAVIAATIILTNLQAYYVAIVVVVFAFVFATKMSKSDKRRDKPRFPHHHRHNHNNK